jgi:hypothetical protein
MDLRIRAATLNATNNAEKDNEGKEQSQDVRQNGHRRRRALNSAIQAAARSPSQIGAIRK